MHDAKSGRLPNGNSVTPALEVGHKMTEHVDEVVGSEAQPSSSGFSATAANGPLPRFRSKRGNAPIPTILTPKVLKAIRLLSTGIPAPEACKMSGVGYRYFNRIIKAPIGKEYFAELSKKVETAFVDKASAVHEANEGKTATQSIIQNEIDESVLEAVQELRQILKTSRSDVARSNAARELLDLAQAKKRYMAMQQGDDAGAALTVTDIAAFTAVVSDLRSLSAPNTPDGNVAPSTETTAVDEPITRAVDVAFDAVETITDIPMTDNSLISHNEDVAPVGTDS